MRAGWVGNTELQKRVQRDDPLADVIVEASAFEASDVKETHGEWSDADSGSGLAFPDDGGVRLSGSDLTHTSWDDPSYTANVVTDLDNTTPIEAVEVQWTDTFAHSFELHQVEIQFDPDVDGTGRNVDRLVCQLFRLAANDERSRTGGHELQPISGPVSASVSSDSVASFTFTFTTADGSPPRVGDSADGASLPRTVIRVWALQDDGSGATNCAWLGDGSSDGTETTTDADLAHIRLTEITGFRAEVGSGYQRVELADMPRFILRGKSFTAATASYTGASNQIDLGASPGSDTDLELVAQGEEPSDSTLAFEINDGSGWVEFFDGDVIGENNSSTGGADLSGVTRQQTYDIRVTLTPDTNQTATPIARRMGVQELSTTDLSPVLASTSVKWSFDPLDLVASIPEATIALIRDGITDYRDAATELFAENHIGSLEFRVFIGHEDMDRRDWLHIDSFLVDDIQSPGDQITVTGVSPTEQLKTKIPPYDSVNGERTPTTYDTDSLKTVYDDLLDSQIALPGRYRGPGVEDDSTTVTKRLTDAEGKAELDAIAYLAGGAVISSQGRVKFQQVMADAPIRAVLPMSEQTLQTGTPGYRSRVDEFFVPFAWSGGRNEFLSEARAFHLDSITKLGRAHIDPPGDLPAETARWIRNEGTEDNPASQVAQDIADRVVDHFGTGIATLRVHASIPHPYLECGDHVAVQTDRMVLRRPEDDAEIRGTVWAYGVVQAVEDVWGRKLTVWVKRFSEALPSNELVDRAQLAPASGFQNLFTQDAGPEQTNTDTSAIINYNYTASTDGGASTTGGYTSLPYGGLDAGDVFSVAMRLRSDGTKGTRMLIQSRDSGGVATTIHVGGSWYYGTSEENRIAEDLTIPSDAVEFRIIANRNNTDPNGQTWSRHAMLTRGPVARTFSEPPLRHGERTDDTVSNLADDGNATADILVGDSTKTPPARHVESGTAQDGDSITFTQSYESPPKIHFVPQSGISYFSSASSNDHRIDIRAVSLSVSGFDLRAKLITSSTTTTTVNDGFSGSQNSAAPENGDVTLDQDGEVAYSNLEDANGNETTYKAFFDVDTSSLNRGENVTVHLEHNSSAGGSSWTEVDSAFYNAGVSFSDQSLSFTASLGADYDLRLRVTTNAASGTFSVTAHGEDNTQPGVTYEKVTSTGTPVGMTPNTDDAIYWEAKEAP